MLNHHGWAKALRPAAALVALGAALGGCSGPRFYGDLGRGSGPSVGWGGGYPAGSPSGPPSHRVRGEEWSWQRQRDAWREQARQPR